MNESKFIFLEKRGYVEKVDATEHIRLWYSGRKGVTLLLKNERWFIVQAVD